MDYFLVFARSMDGIKVRFLVNALSPEDARTNAHLHPEHRDHLILAAVRLSF